VESVLVALIRPVEAVRWWYDLGLLEVWLGEVNAWLGLLCDFWVKILSLLSIKVPELAHIIKQIIFFQLCDYLRIQIIADSSIILLFWLLIWKLCNTFRFWFSSSWLWYLRRVDFYVLLVFEVLKTTFLLQCVRINWCHYDVIAVHIDVAPK
jgi:hypothetical protein